MRKGEGRPLANALRATEASFGEAIVGIEADARERPQRTRVVHERAAAHHVARALVAERDRALRVHRWTVLVERLVVDVVAPLPDVARHVERSVGRCAVGMRADRRGAVVRSAEARVARRRLGAPPWILSAVRAAGGLLPFGFGGEPPSGPRGVR